MMCRRISLFVCLFTALALVSIGYGYGGSVVVGNFETGLDGWFSNDATLSQSTTGATLDSSAMQVDAPGTWKQAALLDAKSHMDILGTGGTISMDITMSDADTDGTEMSAQVVINGEDAGTNNIGWRELSWHDLVLDGAPHSYSWEIDQALADDIAAADASTIGWFEMVLVCNNDANNVTFQVDNIQIKEPPLTLSFTIGDFESDVDGFSAGGDVDLSQTTTGATTGSGALEVNPVDAYTSGFKWAFQSNNQGVFAAALGFNARLVADVTVIPSEWVSDGGDGDIWLNLGDVAIQGDGLGWTQFTNDGADFSVYGQEAIDDIHQMTITWDLSGFDWSTLPSSPTWAQIIFSTNFDTNGGTLTSIGNFYFDNIRIETDQEVLGPKIEPFVLGDWEQDLDNWVLQGSNTYSFSTTGASLNEYALAVEMTQTDWNEALKLDIINSDPNSKDAILQALKDGQYIQVELTRLVADFPGGTDDWGHSGLHFIFNAGGDAWSNYYQSDYFNWWVRAHGDSIKSTVTWEYLSVLESMDLDNVNFFEFTIVPNYGASYGSGTYILDNLRILPRLKATKPAPAAGSTEVNREVVLSWLEGIHIVGQNVYIGTKMSDVSSVNQDNLGDYPDVLFQATGPDESMLDMGILDLDTTYYWKVDQVGDANNVGTKEGDVWSFTVANYIMLEDFESYEDIVALNAAWPDANDLSTDIVNSGSQAMKTVYDNAVSPYYTELSYTLPAGLNDLTQQGARGLRASFYGDPNNQDEWMYVLLEDDQANSSVVFYDGDPENLKKEQWQAWEISLLSFDAVDLSNVTRIAFGFGDPENPIAGTAGVMYFDDVQLFPGRCIFSERTADFANIDIAPLSLGGDCEVGYGELLIIARDWLAVDAILPAGSVDPNSPGGGLVGHYKLDEGEGTTTAEGVAGIENGTFNGGVSWVTPGYDGTGAAINVDGSQGSMVQIGTWDPSAGTGQMTISLWMKWAGVFGGGTQGIIGKRDSWGSSGAMRWFIETGDGGGLRLRTESDTIGEYGNGFLDSYEGTWAHLAVTFDGVTASIYVNGQEVASGPFELDDMVDASIGIGNTHGAGNADSDECFNGQIDEVQIYNRALSVDEVRYLADLTKGDGELYVPVPSQADFSSDEPAGQKSINFKDFAVLASYWLVDQTWPY